MHIIYTHKKGNRLVTRRNKVSKVRKSIKTDLRPDKLKKLNKTD